MARSTLREFQAGPKWPRSPPPFLLTFYRSRRILVLMGNRSEVPYGTLDLMVLKTLDTMGKLHGYGIARRIEQAAAETLDLNQGTIYPALLRLEQKGWIASEWGVSDNNRRARYYAITRAGRKQLSLETENWSRTVAMMKRLLEARDCDPRVSPYAGVPGARPRHAARGAAGGRDRNPPRAAPGRTGAPRYGARRRARGGPAAVRRRGANPRTLPRAALSGPRR